MARGYYIGQCSLKTIASHKLSDLLKDYHFEIQHKDSLLTHLALDFLVWMVKLMLIMC